MKLPRLWVALLAILIGYASCKDDNRVGFDMIKDKVLVTSADILYDIQTRPITMDTVSGFNSGYALAGSVDDPIFGHSDLLTATEMELYGYTPVFGDDDIPYGTNPRIDPVVMSLSYDTVYSRSVTLGSKYIAQELDIRLLTDTIPTGAYFHTKPDAFLGTTVLAHLTHTPANTTNEIVRFRITNQDFIDHLFDDPEVDFKSNAALQDKFKGIALVPNGASNNSIVRYHLYNDSTRMRIYFKCDEIADIDTVVYKDLKVGLFSRMYTYANHDYQTAVFSAALDNESASDPGRIYVQSMGGARTLIKFPNIENWRANEGVILRAAELVLQPDESTISPDFPMLDYMTLYKLNEYGQLEPLTEYYSSSYQAVSYDKIDGTYRFDVTSYVKNRIDNPTEADYGLVMMISSRSIMLGRNVLHSATSTDVAKRAYLKLTYTEMD